MSTELRERIVVVGSGFAGLAVAARLAESGWPVIVLEAGDHIGGQASTWNQGWLHSGAFFAIDHPQLAGDCYRSLLQTLDFCPDAVEPDEEGMLYIASHPATDVAIWEEAWRAAGIPFLRVSRDDVLARIPGLNPDLVQQAFQLPDRSFRPDILLESLAAGVRNAGCEILLNTRVQGFVREGCCIHGVETADGETIRGTRVILATGAAIVDQWPELFPTDPGSQPAYRSVILKAHLVSTRPEVCRTPFCIFDRQGFNHLPHREASVFGSGRWPVTHKPRDITVERTEADALWTQVSMLFPEFQREEFREVHEWAGTSIEILHVDQIAPSVAPQPAVINHGCEAPNCHNLWSVFPGRATMWVMLAEMARAKLLEDTGGRSAATAAHPPWLNEVTHPEAKSS